MLAFNIESTSISFQINLVKYKFLAYKSKLSEIQNVRIHSHRPTSIQTVTSSMEWMRRNIDIQLIEVSDWNNTCTRNVDWVRNAKGRSIYENIKHLCPILALRCSVWKKKESRIQGTSTPIEIKARKETWRTVWKDIKLLYQCAHVALYAFTNLVKNDIKLLSQWEWQVRSRENEKF